MAGEINSLSFVRFSSVHQLLSLFISHAHFSVWIHYLLSYIFAIIASFSVSLLISFIPFLFIFLLSHGFFQPFFNSFLFPEFFHFCIFILCFFFFFPAQHIIQSLWSLSLLICHSSFLKFFLLPCCSSNCAFLKSLCVSL